MALARSLDSAKMRYCQRIFNLANAIAQVVNEDRPSMRKRNAEFINGLHNADLSSVLEAGRR